MLLSSLDDKISNWNDGTEIGFIFLENAPVLKLYVEYVNNYENSVRTIAECIKNKNFVDFVVETVGLVDTYPLSSLLIQPIQRIPRYEMLLSDLVKHTWDSHPDMESLQKALAVIKANAQFVNAQKKDSKIPKNYWISKPKWA
jgi:FYVE/RhoGEF/PH domain-containing protein 3